MPGIAGIIYEGLHPGDSSGQVEAMAGCMMHEQFYKVGRHFCKALGVCAYSVAHPNSFASTSPVWNETNDVCLVLSGETLPEEGEIERLRRRGHDFVPGNAGYLVHAYEEEGIGFVDRLNGWFSGVLVDMRNDCAVLFNDRYGLGRIYYCQTPEGLFFSSEAKSLLKVLPEVRKLDSRSLAEVLSCGCALQDRTLFAGMSLLPAGSRWLFRRGASTCKDIYFDKRAWESETPLDEESYYQALKDAFVRVLPKYLKAESRIGMSLTGGLDGRMIMAAPTMDRRNVACYTFGGMYRECADVIIARHVAGTCQMPHQVIRVDGKFLADFRNSAEKAVYISDGAMNVSGSVELYVNRIARDIAPVRLTGNYGSEILRGNVAFQPRGWDPEFITPEFAGQIDAASETYSNERKGNLLSFIAFKQVPWYHYSRLSIEQSQLILRSPYLDNDLVSLSYRAPANGASKTRAMLRFISDANADLGMIPTDRGVLERASFVGSLRRACRELAIKAENAYDVGMPQWLVGVDRVLSPLRLENLFVGRNRFYHFRLWYRRELAEYIKEVLLDKGTRERPYLRGARMEKMINSHIEGRRNYTLEIQTFLTTELIERQLVDRN